MKKLLFILLLISSVSNGQIVINRSFGTLTSQTTNATSFGVGPATYTAGRLYIYVAQTTGTTNAGTISSTTLTWDNLGGIGNSTNRIQVYRCMPSATVSGETVTLGTFGGGSTGYTVTIYEITGVVQTGTNGADAVAQINSAGPTTGADPAITLSALSGSGSAVIGWFSNDANPFAGTQEAGGWSEIYDSGYSSPTTGFYETARNGTTDNTVVVTAASSTWIGVALELRMRPNNGFFQLFKH